MAELSNGTRAILEDVLACPICSQKALKVSEAILSRTERSSYRKTKYIIATCPVCEEQGRGEVSIQITQRF